MRRWWWLVVLALAAVLFGGQVVDVSRDFVTRGKRLTRSTLTGGVVQESPADLAQQAGETVGRFVDPVAYAVARMVRSEYGGGPVAAKIAIAWVARNDAASLGRGVVETINAGARRGVAFGTQAGGNRYGSSIDPYENDLQIAEAVLSGEAPDPTGGAVKFAHRNALGLLPPGTKAWEANEHLVQVTDPDWGLLVCFRRDTPLRFDV